ncbi:hypothetical protein DENSPDRAFT_319139 [Dentipellis sp. KUC8613]|nr:hypothetical protein DENSPDRAFT_319139 [Dentipellis sp. KUC8613]
MAYHLYNPHRFATPPVDSPAYAFDVSDGCPGARFATSSERSTLGTPPHTPTTATATPRYDPLGVLAHVSIAEQNRERIAALNIPRSAPHEVTGGVMSDGRWNVRHPAVQTCLTTRPPRPSLRNRAASSIYALAALSVRLTPFHEHHNDFWNPEVRNDTAEFIDKVMRTEPRLIDTYPCTWLGPQEMLWQSRNFNAAQEKARNEELGITASPNNRKMSLRKRKATKTAAPRAQTDEVVEGLPEPPRKRARKTKPTPKAAAAMAAAAAAANTGAANEEATPAKPTAGATLAPPTKTSPKAPSPLGVFSPIIASASLPDEDGPAAPASRGRTSNKGSKRGSIAPSAPTRLSARPTTHDRSPSTSESSTATSSMAADLKRGRSSSSASSTPATPPEAAQAVDVKSKGEPNDVPEYADAVEDSTEPQADSVHATRARTRAAAKRATVEPEAPAPDAEAMQVDEPEAPKAKSQSRKRAAADDDAAPDEKTVSAPAPKKRKRTSGVTRARTTRRR